MSSMILSLVTFSKICRRLEAEIRECETEIEHTGPGEREILIAEKEALEAELAYRQARYRLDDKNDRLTYIYQKYGELGITMDNCEEYLMRASHDMYNWLKRRDFIEPMVNPTRVVDDLEYLRERASTAERIWIEKIEIWYGKQTAWERKHGSRSGSAV